MVRRKVIKQEIDGVLHVYKLQWYVSSPDCCSDAQIAQEPTSRVIYRVNSEDERSEVLSSVDALVYM